MRVLALTRYDRLGASSRLRTLQFVPGLAAAGIEVVPRPLLDEAFLVRRYAARRADPLAVARAYLARALALRRGELWDLVWLEKEVFPWVPDVLERWSGPLPAPVVAEYDDAWFHRYDQHASPLVRALLGSKLDAIMRRASTVVAGNAYLAERARHAGARRVEILPTCVDVARYVAPRRGSDTMPFTVGWIGTPLTARYLEAVAPALARLSIEGPLRFLAVGAGPLEMPGVVVERAAWSEASEAASIASFDVGIMPLPDSPWERGKCGYKLLQCMAAGRAVVASPVGVNASIVRDGENGFLAADEGAWVGALRTLRDDPSAREAMGARGRRLVEERFSVDANLPRLAAILREAAAR